RSRDRHAAERRDRPSLLRPRAARHAPRARQRAAGPPPQAPRGAAFRPDRAPRTRGQEVGSVYLDSDRKPPITPQLAIRIAIIGGAALVMFGVIFFRLWYMQVLSGDRYLAEANNNRVREINVAAPRGKIVDRNRRLLVGHRTGYAIQITPDKFPKDPAGRQRVYIRLARLLGMRPKEIQRTVQK